MWFGFLCCVGRREKVEPMEFQNYIILNEEYHSIQYHEIIEDPVLLSKNLNKLMKRLKGEYFVDENTIDYANLCQSELFNNDYQKLSNQLTDVDLELLLDENDTVNDQNLLAFFINIYNSLTIHSLAYLSNASDSKVPEGNLLSQMEGQFWSKMAYLIGCKSEAFSLDDIEHGILRANRIHPGKNKVFFSDDDPRKRYSVKNFDPRIHFALNCGAKGCPPIAFYTLENLERGLQMATTNFITNETEIIEEKNVVVLSKLFLWYKADFIGDNVENKDEDMLLIEYVMRYIRKEDVKHSILKNLIDSSTKLTVTFANYDWNINVKN